MQRIWDFEIIVQQRKTNCNAKFSSQTWQMLKQGSLKRIVSSCLPTNACTQVHVPWSILKYPHRALYLKKPFWYVLGQLKTFSPLRLYISRHVQWLKKGRSTLNNFQVCGHQFVLSALGYRSLWMQDIIPYYLKYCAVMA